MKPWVWLAAGVVACAIGWSYMHRILLPWQQYFHVEAGRMKAALGDLYSPWYGSRELLFHGKNPYGAEVTHGIQLAFYGHDVVPENSSAGRPVDEQRFAYPVYVVFLLRPVARLDFEQAQKFAPIPLGLAVAASVCFWLSVLHWRPGLVYGSAVLLVLAQPQVAQGLRLRQIGFIVVFFLALGTWLVVRSSLLAGGAVLALATIKPQMVVLPIAWILIWSLGDIRQRWRLPAAFFGAIALLVGAGEWILPGWPRDFLAGLVAYRRYGPVTTLLQLVFGNMGGLIAGTLVVAGLLAWAWGQRKCAAESLKFTEVLSAVLLGSSLALPLMSPFNQALLILPILQLMKSWAILPRIVRVIFAVFVSWPFVAELVLLLFPPSLRSVRLTPLLPSILVVLFPFALAGLQIVRNAQTRTDQNESLSQYVSH